MSDNKQVGETPSSEVANRFRSCRDLSDIVPLYPSHALYLKPLAKVNVSVSLPQLKTPGKNNIVISISGLLSGGWTSTLFFLPFVPFFLLFQIDITIHFYHKNNVQSL